MQSTGSGDSLQGRCDWAKAVVFAQVSVRCALSGNVCAITVFGVAVSHVPCRQVGAVRRDCCDDSEADAYTAVDGRQETVVSMHACIAA